jgi:FkbM family methyltransferase
MIPALIARSCRLARASLRSGAGWATQVVDRRIPLSHLARGKDGTLRLSPYSGCPLVQKRDNWLLHGHHHALELSRLPDVTLDVQEDGALLVNTGAFRVRARRAEELFILREVLCNRVYSLMRPRQSVIVDIGMNVGISALYFAAHLGCDVYGYEIVPSTFSLALENFALNPVAASRIRFFNCGVGGTTRDVEVNFNSQHRGISTICDRPGESMQTGFDAQIRARVLDVCDVISDVLRQSRLPVVLKMDCEGAEYEILRRITKSSVANDIDGFMIEWHQFMDGQNAESLASMLSTAGFSVVMLGHPRDLAGMMYAFRC